MRFVNVTHYLDQIYEWSEGRPTNYEDCKEMSSISLIVLQDLHWLPIESRSKFKILLLVYKCLYGLAPSYLSKRLSLKPNRGLRSDDKLVLNVPTTKLKTKTYGDRCFSIAGPNLWNQPPSHISVIENVSDDNIISGRNTW